MPDLISVTSGNVPDLIFVASRNVSDLFSIASGNVPDLFSTVSGNVPKFTFADYLLGKRAQVDFFRLSPLLACYIAFPANFGLLSAMVQSDFCSEVIYSKSFLWVPLLL